MHYGPVLLTYDTELCLIAVHIRNQVVFQNFRGYSCTLGQMQPERHLWMDFWVRSDRKNAAEAGSDHSVMGGQPEEKFIWYSALQQCHLLARWYNMKSLRCSHLQTHAEVLKHLDTDVDK